MKDKPDHFVLICSTCKGPLGAEDAGALLQDQLPPGFSIKFVSCMAGCKRPMTVGFQAEAKAQYLFGDIETEADIDALAAFAHQYRAREDGWTNGTERPRALFRKTLSRMPRIEIQSSLEAAE